MRSFIILFAMLLLCVGCKPIGPSPAVKAKVKPKSKPDPESIIKKLTQEVFNAEVELKNPNIIQVENKIQGNDPLTQSTSAYIAITSQMSTMTGSRSVQFFEIEHDRKPTYEEYMQMVKTQGIKFAMLPRYQKYGYDVKNGLVIILEDTEKKKEIYLKAGLDENGN